MIPDNQAEMIRRLRLGNLRNLLRHRCGPTLPDDDAGREYLYCPTQSKYGRHGCQRMRPRGPSTRSS